MAATGTTASSGSTATTEAQRALAEARETGKRVEVVGERSERSTVFANPDGFSFTLEESAVPVRVARPGGGWEAPDATLERLPDGSVAPKAAAVEMEFSGGGQSAPLVRIEKDGHSLALGWPGVLPKPELDGDSALYKEVMAGVDLKVTATTEGFHHVLVVKTPQAAARPELKKIDYSFKAEGLRIVKGANGDLTAVDRDGKRVFRAPPAQMWDSAGSARAPQAQTSKTSTARSQAAGSDGVAASPAAGTDPFEAAAPSAPADNADRGVEPAAGDHVATMDVTVGRGSLAVAPDTKMLTGTASTAFPLYIDPTVTWGASERTLLRSDGYTSYGWSNGTDNEGKGTGHCGSYGGYVCGSGYTQRLYFEFSPASLAGKQVLDATFRATETWSFTCDARWVDLVRTNNISSATTWSSRPSELDWMGDRYVSAGRGTACSPSQPAAPIEFNDNPEETNENLTPTVKDFAAGKFSRLTLELRAHDESDTSAWKRFRNDAVLAVSYVGLPDKPTGLGLVTGSGTVCDKTESDPAIISDPTPTLSATAQTKSGGQSGAQLRVYFDVDEKNSSGTWVDSTDGNGSLRPTSGYVGDGTKLTMSWSTLKEGTLYRYHAWTWSYYGANYLSSAASDGYCYFKVDPTAPKAPQITLGSPYTLCTTNDCAAHGGPGVPAPLTFKPATGDTNNVAYQYKLSSATTWSPEKAGSTVSVSITPASSGTQRLYVRAKDNVGRWGAQQVIDFLVAAGEGPVGQWHFDEASGVAVDSATTPGIPRHDATLGGDAVRDDRGRRGLITHDANGVELASPVTDKGLAVKGTGYAATSGQVLETRSSYTVAAWVRLDKPGANYTVLSQNGVHRSPFYLGYEQALGTWTFRAVNEDAPTTGSWSYQRAASKQAPAWGTWTHLAGVYDATAKQLTLYVNGVPQGTVPYTTAWAATGPLQIGRTWWSDTYTDYVPGSIDEVAVWQRAVTDEEIAKEADAKISEGFAAAELVADWDASRGSGTTVADTTSGYGKTLTLSGATLSGDAIELNGTTGSATAPGPLVDGTGSFTVTTLVELDSAKLAANAGPYPYYGQVLGQRTADGSSWGIWFELTNVVEELDPDTLEPKKKPYGVWHFGRLKADGGTEWVTSEEIAAMDSPVRLTGIYSARTGTISLYLGHNRNGTPLEYTATLGTGEFAVGKGYTNSAWKHYLPAKVQEVRLWAGAMASAEQIDYRVGD
ncbi:LamG-like jellyroll fold domain-containing protein [Streptomyces sp. NPDC053541]|uniref:LamG domain-containing protein n=1 Tax=Streptomyces sp. NPDC053541 TaxID=3365709 RepID=UPI0037D11B4A